MEGQKPAWMRWGGVALGLLVAIMLGLGLKNILVSDKPARKPRLQQITLIKPPPPPPEQKPPEPEIKKEEVKVQEVEQPPEQQADAPPPGQDLGLDAEGTGSGDGFGLAGKKGAADLLGSGKGNPWASYDTLVSDVVSAAFRNALSREKALKDKNYKVVVKVWIGAGGQVTRAVLVDSTGTQKVDELLKEVLRDLRGLRDSPPEDMPQPMKIRVTSRA